MHTLEQLYDQTLDQVFRYVFLRVRNRELAEDIVSEAYLKAAEHFNDFVPRAHASRRSWLFAIVRNCMADAFRTKGMQNVELPDDLPGMTATVIEHDVDTNIRLTEVMHTLAKLPERQREILLLRYQAELKNKEIAQLLAIDERTVSATLSKALTNLRYELRNVPAYV